MKIAVVTETFYPFRGGSAKRYHEVLKRLVKYGYDIDLYTVRLDELWPIREEIDGINIYRTRHVFKEFITPDGFRSVSEVLAFSLLTFRKVEREEYDLIEANHCPIFPAMFSWFSSRFSRRIPLTVTFHEVWWSHWYWYVPWKGYAPVGMILEKFLTRLPDAGIAVSKTTAQRLRLLLGMDENRIRVIPNGVDLELFRRVKAEREHFKVIYTGRLNPHKKLEWLIDALKIVRKTYPEATLDVVGDGPMRSSYMRYAKEAGLSDCINFFGGVEDEELARRLKSAKVYVLPSIREGQSITTLEAMAAGTPQVVVLWDGNGAVDLIRKSRSGLVVKPSPRHIANSIIRLFRDEELWLNLQENGYRFIRGYDWNIIAAKYHKVYRELTGK